MNHQPYGLAGSLSAKVKGFMGLPRSPNVVMRKVISGYQVGTMPDGYNDPAPRLRKGKRPQLENVQVFKTEKTARKYMDSLLTGGL
ncbi:hypothetical protein HMPREF3136_03680 [Neisseria sp. HMSC15C08]|nr:hypothetical protein HMPREF3136_03680 [Neisseria sp. HMSC15C08]